MLCTRLFPCCLEITILFKILEILIFLNSPNICFLFFKFTKLFLTYYLVIIGNVYSKFRDKVPQSLKRKERKKILFFLSTTYHYHLCCFSPAGNHQDNSTIQRRKTPPSAGQTTNKSHKNTQHPS